MKKNKLTSKLKYVLENYVRANKKEYILNLLLFVIGMFVGVMIINNMETIQKEEVNNYILTFINNLKNIENLNIYELIINSIKNDIILAFILWIAGTTVIGVPIVLIAILYRGMCLGYTIAIITTVLGKLKGFSFCLICLGLQNIIFIPAVLTLGVSSIKLYKSIIKDRRKENIKVGIIRHTIISSLMTLCLTFSSIVENIVSMGLLQKLIKYF